MCAAPRRSTAPIVRRAEIMQVADFPYATSIPSFPSHTDVLAYIRRFADAFQLRDHVQFRTVVTKVDPVPFEKTEATAHAPGLPGLRTRWRVTTAPAGSENVNSDGTCKTSVSESDSAAADGGHGSRVIESNGSDAAATTAMYDFLSKREAAGLLLAGANHSCARAGLSCLQRSLRCAPAGRVAWAGALSRRGKTSPLLSNCVPCWKFRD